MGQLADGEGTADAASPSPRDGLGVGVCWEAARASSNAATVAASTQLPTARVDAIPQVQAEKTPLLEARRDRMHRAKKPPIWLWVFMGALALLAMVLFILQMR